VSSSRRQYAGQAVCGRQEPSKAQVKKKKKSRNKQQAGRRWRWAGRQKVEEKW